MTWHLNQVLQTFDHQIDDLSNTTLTQSFIFQLVSNDLYEWVVYVPMTIPNQETRQHTVKEILCQHCIHVDASENNFLASIAIPDAWIHCGHRSICTLYL
jgi:Nuclear protein 96